MFDVAPAFQNNPKEDGEIKEAGTDPFQVQSDLSNVHDLSFCPLKTIEEVCSFFLLLCEVDRLKEAQYSEEVRQVVQLVFVGGTCEVLEIICHYITEAIKRKSPSTVSCDAFQISIRSFKEPLAVSLFRSRLLIAQWSIVSFVVQDGRWEKEDADAEINRGTSTSTTYY